MDPEWVEKDIKVSLRSLQLLSLQLVITTNHCGDVWMQGEDDRKVYYCTIYNEVCASFNLTFQNPLSCNFKSIQVSESIYHSKEKRKVREEDVEAVCALYRETRS